MQCIQIESAQIALNLLPFCIELRYQLNFFQLCRSLGVLVFFLSLYSCVWRHLMNIPPESFLLGRCVYLYLCICIFVFVCLYLCICLFVFVYLDLDWEQEASNEYATRVLIPSSPIKSCGFHSPLISCKSKCTSLN